ncbi:EF1Bgamma1 [Lipomyces oligophaga]|uniref:EF1Bgamma1 n=1 Tax=Lipomyces oligophaga TaxID=45792 RepID=UPI0034CD3F28
MSFGKLYGYIGNPRTGVSLMAAKLAGLDVELVTMGGGNFSDDYAELVPIKKIPAFVGTDGAFLTEVIAIVTYFLSQVDSPALGTTKLEKAEVLRWLSFSNMEVAAKLSLWWQPLVGRLPYNKKNVEKAEAESDDYLIILEKQLTAHTFLVGERCTIADVFSAALIYRAFQYVFGASWRAKYPAITRWFTLITNQPFWDTLKPAPAVFVEEAVKYTPPKKEPVKKEAKKEAPAAQPEEEETKEKAAPHPIAALGNAKLPIDSWKRTYSNEDTRPVALPWFWDHFDPEEYSLWRVNYKYNDELTLTFMSSNLIGGFFNRLSASTKYLFGCLLVFGTSNDSVITGAFLVRGQDYKPAFDVAPDWESYEFIKLDPSKAEDKSFVEDMWAWDKPLAVEGGSKEFADGKVFK